MVSRGRSDPTPEPGKGRWTVGELDHVFDGNRAWADRHRSQDRGYFEGLAAGQDPDIFWIGCVDSRVPPDTITRLKSGELFVHRNIANLVLPADTNGLSSLEYAVRALEVGHIVVCGHTGCGGVESALEGADLDHVDDWIQEIERVRRAHEDELMTLEDPRELANRFSELNVKAQVENLARSSIVQDVWESGQSLVLHGWIFRLESGTLEDLDVSRDG